VDVQDLKRAVRERQRAARRALPEAERAAADDLLLGHLREAVQRLRPGTLAAYVPVGTEPGGPGLVAALALGAGPAVRVLLPVLLPGGDLDWAGAGGPGDRPAVGPHGLREPVGPRLGVCAVERADLVVVPALAVDRRGVRLGRGGGSYDRALARVPPGVPVVALLHDGELVDGLPTEPHDRPVTAVATPSGGWRDVPLPVL